jgi:hypothetical protein
MNVLQRSLKRFSVRELILIAAMAAAGIAVKPVIVPLAHLISRPLMIPGGALAGGLYMMWLVVAMGLTQKYGAGTLVGLIQAILVMVAGVSGSHGIMSLISYTMPGIVMDLGLWIIRHRVCCRSCAFLAGILANATGAIMVNMIFFSLPLIPLLLSIMAASFSGGVGGLLAWQLLMALRKFHIGNLNQTQDSGHSNLGG